MKLFILVSDLGDGSYYPRFILDEKVIEEIEELFDAGHWDYENGFGCDGDGFHYTSIDVPDGSDRHSLDISEHRLYTREALEEWKKNFL